MAAQLELALPRPVKRERHPGGRPPKGPRSSERHERRETLKATEPVHVTIRVVAAVSSLRTRKLYRAIRWATLTAARRERFRVVHVSIQRNHIHLLVEAANRMTLARGMQGLQISAARNINAALGRRGQVFADRYRAHVLRSPREARHALVYVMNNWRRHGEDRGRAGSVDPFSTGVCFAGWRELADSPVLYKPPPTYEPLIVWNPTSWLLREGWRKHGLISVAERPGPQPRPRRRG